jgi:hypothetical protein
MNTQIEQPNQPSSEAEKLVQPSKMSRREALAIVGKHAVYTAPAVLAVLSLTKSTDALAAGSNCPGGPGTCD